MSRLMLPRYRWILTLVCLSLATPSSPALAQSSAEKSSSDKLGATLGLTPQSKSLPLWTKPAESSVQEMADTIKSLKQGILLVGDPETGFGTAFVISRKNRLLATNAHVADIMKDAGRMAGIRNGTSVLYEVDKAWYHPGVRRFKNSQFSVRSQNPADGDVDPNSPDVAVLHVADGPELPVEFSLATVAEEEDCLGAPIGMLGYPGHDTESWPKLGERAQATLREGVICRLTDFLGGVSGTSAEMQKLQHSLVSWHGFSGSPLFLPNGHIVGLHNSGRGVTIESENRHVELAYGVRVDCLWELLAYHHLDPQVALPLAKDKLLLARYEKPDPALEKYDEAAKLVAECDHLLLERRFNEAVEKCNLATKLCPGYSKAYMTRAVLYTVSNIDRYPGGIVAGGPVNEEQLKYALYAEQDAQTCMEMNPNDAEAYLRYCMKVTDVDVIRKIYNEKRHDVVVDVATKLINDPSTSRLVKVRAFTARAAANTNVPNNYLIADEIYADYNAAIRLDPFNAHCWRNRAAFSQTGSEQATSDLRRAQELDTADQDAGAAMYLAGAGDPKERDGRKAWDLAIKANTVTDYKNPGHLSALAAAYAESGDFDHAIEFGKKAVQLADGDQKDQITGQLKLYENKQPFRASNH